MTRTVILRGWAAGVLAAVAACGGGGSGSATPTSPTSTAPPTTTTTTPAPPSSTFSGWGFTGDAWQAIGGTPPACPNPLTLPLPVSIDRATSVLYPGQTRGGDYKPHGGFRFDGAGQTNSVTVTAPMAATVLRGSRYLEGGEIQYLFDFVNACGILYRFDHLRDLSARFQAMADAFPSATEGASATTTISGQAVSSGETIATAVGHRTPSNVSFDWGVYDLRQRNASSADPGWLASHPGEMAPYGICWFDLLPAADAARVRALPPGDGQAGRTSDYCR
jgi:hypothetical protein